MASIGDIRTGSRGRFHWLTGKRAGLRTLVSACPEIVLGKHVLVTAYATGRFLPTPDEITAGWRIVGAVAVSPIVEDVASLPAEGWDEWYVSGTAETPGRPEVFVNAGGFRLDFPVAKTGGAAWDIGRALFGAEGDELWSEGLIDRFWRQLDRIGAESYLASGHRLNFATRDSVLFYTVRSRLEPDAD